jgi:hypothetical protein
MMRALDFIFRYCHPHCGCCCAFSVGRMVYLRVSSSGKPRVSDKEHFVFCSASYCGLLAGLTSDSIAQGQTLDFLRSVSARASVCINGDEVQNSDEILNALRGIRKLLPHHSDPTRTMRVEISDGTRSLLLLVARDSADPHEYWVFAPSPSKLALRWNLEKDIGHVITPVLDQY